MHHFDKGTPLEETLGTLEELRVMGKIRFAGASNYNGEQLATTLDVAHTQQLPPISSVQNHLNMLKRGGESDWLPLCVKSGVAVLVYGALARGILSGKYLSSRSVPVGSRASVSDSVRGDLAPEVLSTVDALSQLAEELGVKVEQLAVAWTLSRPGITSLILGVRTRDQIEDHVKALELRLGQAELARVDAVLGHVNRFDKYGLGAFIPR